MLAWLKMARFVFPVIALMAFFQGTAAFDWVVQHVEPVMAPLGLPGVAAMAMMTGVLINKFAGIASLLVLPLNQAQFLVAAVILSLAHNVPSEMLIVWESRLPVFLVGLIRVAVGYVAGWLVQLFLTLTGWLSTDPLPALLISPHHQSSPLLQATLTVLKMAYFLLPLFLLLEALRQFQLLSLLERFARPLTRSLRLPQSLTPALLAGLLLGVATGAGMISDSLRRPEEHEQHHDPAQPAQPPSPSRRDLWRLNLFLLHFHSVVEDTLMFALFPVPLLAIAAIRFAVAWFVCRLVR